MLDFGSFFSPRCEGLSVCVCLVQCSCTSFVSTQDSDAFDYCFFLLCFASVGFVSWKIVVHLLLFFLGKK